MFCRNCGNQVHEAAVACPSCGVPPRLEKKFCPNCGANTQTSQAICTKCGNLLGAVAGAPGSKNKTTAGLLALFLGVFGVHKFYLGYNTAAIIYLAVSLGAGLITCGAATVVMSILALIEGIIYLTKSDEEFERVYVQGQKPWF